MPQSAATTAVRNELTSLRVKRPGGKPYMAAGPTKHAVKLPFVSSGKGAQRMRLEMVIPFLTRPSATSLVILLAQLSWIPSDFEFADNIKLLSIQVEVSHRLQTQFKWCSRPWFCPRSVFVV